MTIIRMAIVFLVFIVLNVYLFMRGWQAVPGNSAVHVVYTILFIVASTAVFFAVFAANKLPLWIAWAMDVVGGYWMILFVFMITAALLADVLRLGHHYFHIFPEWITGNYVKAKLLYLLSVFFILALISIIGYIRFSNPRVTELKLTVDKDYAKADEITLVVASDIHLGNLIRKGRLAKWVDLINKQNPDAILIAGDLFDHSMRTVESQEMNRELLRLDAKYGVYAIPGNHDYYAGIDHAIKYMKSAGIMVLRDQALTIDYRFVIIGRDDLTNKNRKALSKLMTGLNDKLPKIVLDHQPLSITESVENKVDLHISGHTHNGQIFPFNKIVAMIYELSFGYRQSGNTHIYVSSGLGLWGAPIRLGSSSEIVKITLKARNKTKPLIGSE
jgi:predicted MPP superfamily phosphohydrolase